MPSTSKAQQGAMCAACAGRSRRGISRKVGCEFCRSTRNVKSLPGRVGKRRR